MTDNKRPDKELYNEALAKGARAEAAACAPFASAVMDAMDGGDGDMCWRLDGLSPAAVLAGSTLADMLEEAGNRLAAPLRCLIARHDRIAPICLTVEHLLQDTRSYAIVRGGCCPDAVFDHAERKVGPASPMLGATELSFNGESSENIRKAFGELPRYCRVLHLGATPSAALTALCSLLDDFDWALITP